MVGFYAVDPYSVQWMKLPSVDSSDKESVFTFSYKDQTQFQIGTYNLPRQHVLKGEDHSKDFQDIFK